MICRFWPKIPLSWTECPVSRALPSLWSLYLSPLIQIIHNGALNWFCFGKNYCNFFELQDLCPVPERTAQQWCLNMFVSELTHSALYTLIHMKDKKKSFMYIHVCLCVYIYLYRDWHGQMNVEMIELSCFFCVNICIQ